MESEHLENGSANVIFRLRKRDKKTKECVEGGLVLAMVVKEGHSLGGDICEASEKETLRSKGRGIVSQDPWVGKELGVSQGQGQRQCHIEKEDPGKRSCSRHRLNV